MAQEVTREQVVVATMAVLRTAADWQDGQHYLADHPRFRPWIDEAAAGDEPAALAIAQGIIREAEERLGEAVPY